MYASSWMLERPFGAMCGWRGGSGAKIGLAAAGLPTKAGSEFGPSGIGFAAKAGVAKAMAADAARTTARMREGCPLGRRCTPPGLSRQQVFAPGFADHLLVAREARLDERYQSQDLRDRALRLDLAAGEGH